MRVRYSQSSLCSEIGTGNSKIEQDSEKHENIYFTRGKNKILGPLLLCPLIKYILFFTLLFYLRNPGVNLRVKPVTTKPSVFY
jgi:hypothetical protein